MGAETCMFRSSVLAKACVAVHIIYKDEHALVHMCRSPQALSFCVETNVLYFFLHLHAASDDERRAGNVASSRSSNGRHGQPPQLRSSSAAPSSHVEAAVGQVPQQSNGSRFKQQVRE